MGLDIQTDLKVFDFLEITLNLNDVTASPFKKLNQKSCYINILSRCLNKSPMIWGLECPAILLIFTF